MPSPTTIGPTAAEPRLPTHLDLPETDGKPVENLLEKPQSKILDAALTPILEKLHPDGKFLLASDVGIYWKITSGDPLRGCKSPDYYYVPHVPAMLDGTYRRSYVLWNELVPPLIAFEFVSGDGSEERDRTPETGKFWVYERGIKIQYYVIWTAVPADLEVYELVNGRYQPVRPNEAGRYVVPPLGIELGLWHGLYDRQSFHWLRVWDSKGNLLPTYEDQIGSANDKATALAAKLRALGVDPDSVTG